MLCLLVLGCQAPGQPYAPVVNGWQQGKADYHRVKRGETLYAIAWYYGYDYRDLARINQLNSPYGISVGEKIFFSPRKVNKPIRIKNQQLLVKKKLVASIADTAKGKWLWPTEGNVVKGFNEQGSISKGIDISGKLRQPIYASLSGEVVYSGSGLVGYGNLIIIKHSDDYLSAYAYNAANLVSEGNWVTRGQKIALMGQAESNGSRLHFEIRQHGKPVNPVLYIR